MSSQVAQHLLRLDAQINRFAEGDANGNNDKLNHVLQKHKDSIVNIMGGLTTMIHLCLTNINAHKYLDSKKIAAFEHILYEEQIISFTSNINVPSSENILINEKINLLLVTMLNECRYG